MGKYFKLFGVNYIAAVLAQWCESSRTGDNNNSYFYNFNSCPKEIADFETLAFYVSLSELINTLSIGNFVGIFQYCFLYEIK